MNTPNDKYFEHPIVNPRFLNKNYPEFYEYLKNHYPNITSISEALYLWKQNIEMPPICPVCGNPVKFLGIKRGYSTYCSYKCSNKHSVNKKKQTCLEKYGVDNVNKVKAIKEKAKQTCLEKYGVDNPFKSENIKKKIRHTNLEKYGVEWNTLSPEINEKRKNTFMTNHPGLTSPLQLEKTILSRNKSRENKVLNEHNDIISVDFNTNEYICSCPHPECDKCKLKTFHIHPSTYFDRKRDNTELCTNLLPYGSNNSSGTTIELFVRNILDKYNIEYRTNIRDIISPKEIDIYIPSKQIAIECNGVYWHSLKPSNYHINKFKQCQNNHIQLITIWEDWIKNKQNIVESIILSKLGIYNERIYARQCSIREINTKSCNEFLENNHIQGRTNSTIKYGLFKNNELVGVMTFGKKRMGQGNNKKNENIWELSRFCTKLNTQIIGGAEKLLKHFINDYNPLQIYSFSSNDISFGDLYNKLGFDKRNINSSYWYISQKFIRYHRSNFMKCALIKQGYDPNKTESEIMRERGYLRIYDSGQTKWVMNL